MASLLRRATITLAGFSMAAAVAYAQAGRSPENLPERAASFLLLPGTALYVLLNGSLLFGGGFGDAGNFLVIALGSALAWTLALLVALGTAERLGRRRRNREPAP